MFIGLEWVQVTWILGKKQWALMMATQAQGVDQCEWDNKSLIALSCVVFEWLLLSVLWGL